MPPASAWENQSRFGRQSPPSSTCSASPCCPTSPPLPHMRRTGRSNQEERSRRGERSMSAERRGPRRRSRRLERRATPLLRSVLALFALCCPVTSRPLDLSLSLLISLCLISTSPCTLSVALLSVAVFVTFSLSRSLSALSALSLSVSPYRNTPASGVLTTCFSLLEHVCLQCYCGAEGTARKTADER